MQDRDPPAPDSLEEILDREVSGEADDAPPPGPDLAALVAARQSTGGQDAGMVRRARLQALFNDPAVQHLREQAAQFGVTHLFFEDSRWKPMINVCGRRIEWREDIGCYQAGRTGSRQTDADLQTESIEEAANWIAHRLSIFAAENLRREQLAAEARAGKRDGGGRAILKLLQWLVGLAFLAAMAWAARQYGLI